MAPGWFWKADYFRCTNLGWYLLEGLPGIVDDIGITAFRSEYQHEITNEGSIFEGYASKHIGMTIYPIYGEKWLRLTLLLLLMTGSDSHGICVAGVAEDGDVYVLDSWEKRATLSLVSRRLCTLQ